MHPPTNPQRLSLILALLFSPLLTAQQQEDPGLLFRHDYIAEDLGPGRAWGQTALADLDRDGDLDFVVGLRGGDVLWFENDTDAPWIRRKLGSKSPSDVGGAALDVNRDGWLDFVTGGVWYENPRKPREAEFVRHVFDADLAAVHDIETGDIDGDGTADVVTMSDRNDLRWYRAPADPSAPWPYSRIFDPVHSGIALGDLDRDGDLDIVRSDIWLENLNQGSDWAEHRLSEPWGDRSSAFSYNATRTQIADINGDGRVDVVVTDGEIKGARAAWLEAPEDPAEDSWKVHYLAPGDDQARGAYHALQVGDFDGDGDSDVLTVEMERVVGDRSPRWFIWENVDGRGLFVERVILDANLGGHEAVAGDVDGDGDLDIISKPWAAGEWNAVGGRNHIDLLENVTARR